MKSGSSKKSLFWFRRDLRLNDNCGLAAALTAALESGSPVLPMFIFDHEILNALADRADARVNFIHQALVELDAELRTHGSSLHVYIGKPDQVFRQIFKDHEITSIFTNRDYEPYAIERDAKIEELASAHGASFLTFKDQVIFEQNEVTKDDGKPYTMFTPYSRKWLAALKPSDLKSSESEKYLDGLLKSKDGKVPTLKEIGFEKTSIPLPAVRPEANDKLIGKYLETRNYPANPVSTSRLGLHMRFGTLSIRDLMKSAKKPTEKTWLKELIWREFFMQILWHFPHVVKGAFRPEYDKIPFRNDKDDWKAWTEGKTGFAIVDAGMRELNATGFMHNRVRMIAASVLVKHLLIHWKLGEAYFAEKLLDFELSSNNGNWQWVAGSGCDASPYFRVFNPDMQQKKFDPKFEYIKKWVPEYGTSKQLEPIIDPITARTRVLRAYKLALNRQTPESNKAKPSPSKTTSSKKKKTTTTMTTKRAPIRKKNS